MKNIFKITTLLLIIVANMGCGSILRTMMTDTISDAQGTFWTFDLKPNESISIGDIQEKGISIFPDWNDDEKTDYLSKNENVIIKNKSNKNLLFTTQINGKSDQQILAKHKSITVTISKRSVFTLHNENIQPAKISIFSPVKYHYKYKKIIQP